MRPRVLITRPVNQKAIDQVAEHCDVRVYPIDGPMSPELLAEELRGMDFAMPCGQKVSGEAIAEASKLRMIANIGAGYDNIDLEACNRRRIVVTNTPDVLSEATADIAFALLISAARRVVEGDRYVRQGNWPHWQWNFLWGADLHGKTLGLYGCGRIGQAMARRGRGFSMRILYHARHRIDAAIEKELHAELVDRETLLRESDFLSVHVPSTTETRHSIGKAEIALMKPSAFVINSARGNIIDEEALAQALGAGQIQGAGLDVFENEPKVHPALIGMNNVTLLPHIGSATAQTRFKMAALAAENLIAFLQGRRPPNLVNPQVLE
jgi:glyoxylate reductase